MEYEKTVCINNGAVSGQKSFVQEIDENTFCSFQTSKTRSYLSPIIALQEQLSFLDVLAYIRQPFGHSTLAGIFLAIYEVRSQVCAPAFVLIPLKVGFYSQVKYKFIAFASSIVWHFQWHFYSQ